MTGEHLFVMVTNRCSLRSWYSWARTRPLDRGCAAVRRPRPEVRLPRPGLRHALDDRVVALRRRCAQGDLGDPAGERPLGRDDSPGGAAHPALNVVLTASVPASGAVSTIADGGPRHRVPRHVGQCADRTARAKRPSRAAGRRAPALRLRRGHAAPAPALDGRARRSARDLPHALPRRPLPRPAGDAEDVRAPRPRRAAHRLRAAGSARPLRRAPAGLRQAHLPARARRGASGGGARAGRLQAARLPGLARRVRRRATRSSRRLAQAASTSRPPTRSACLQAASGACSSAASRSRCRTDGR